MSTIEEPSEDELFEAATTDQPEAEAQPEGQANEQEAEQSGQARDEAGRFAAKAADEPAATTEADPPARTPVDDNAATVPSWRVREINEEKRALLAERDALMAERVQWQNQQRQQQQPAPRQAEKAARPDPLLDPDGYAEWVENRANERYLHNIREDSLQRARASNPKEFDEAYAAAGRVIDPGLRARMQNSRDPGATLLDWHRENKVKAEVGSDPNAWLEKKLEERLKDPAFLAKAVELARGNAQPQANGRPRIELPPSLNGASRSNAALRSSNQDVSDSELFDQTTG